MGDEKSKYQEYMNHKAGKKKVCKDTERTFKKWLEKSAHLYIEPDPLKWACGYGGWIVLNSSVFFFIFHL
jgi:hypothetical protein